MAIRTIVHYTPTTVRRKHMGQIGGEAVRSQIVLKVRVELIRQHHYLGLVCCLVTRDCTSPEWSTLSSFHALSHTSQQT